MVGGRAGDAAQRRGCRVHRAQPGGVGLQPRPRIPRCTNNASLWIMAVPGLTFNSAEGGYTAMLRCRNMAASRHVLTGIQKNDMSQACTCPYDNLPHLVCLPHLAGSLDSTQATAEDLGESARGAFVKGAKVDICTLVICTLVLWCQICIMVPSLPAAEICKHCVDRVACFVSCRCRTSSGGARRGGGARVQRDHVAAARCPPQTQVHHVVCQGSSMLISAIYPCFVPHPLITPEQQLLP